MIQAGKLRHKIQLMVPPPALSSDSIGAYSKTYVPGPLIYARIEPLRGRKMFEAQQLQSDATHKVCIRYRCGLLTNQRFMFNGRTFEFGVPLSEEENFHEIWMLATEVLTSPAP